MVAELTTIIVPKSPAALATVTPPSGSKFCNPPIGASMTGIRILWPRKVVEQSMLETSARIRGRKARRSNANRLRRMVVSDSDAPVR